MLSKTTLCRSGQLWSLSTSNSALKLGSTPGTTSLMGGNSANQASDASTSSQPPAESSSGSHSASQAMKFAGNASLHSLDPSSTLYPLQIDADFYWNADTGATAHMTPHRH